LPDVEPKRFAAHVFRVKVVSHDGTAVHNKLYYKKTVQNELFIILLSLM